MALKPRLKHLADQVTQRLLSHAFPSRVQPTWLREQLLSYPRSGGKCLRPALALWFAELAGGKEMVGLDAACAIEIFHTWTLVHDDVIDRDSFRRGVPTAHYALSAHARSSYGLAEAQAEHFGLSMAILVGDLQQAWALDLLLGTPDLPPATVRALAQRLCAEVNPLLLSGEAIDVEFEHRPLTSIRPEEITAMLDGKTACLMAFAAEAGVLMGLGLGAEGWAHPQVRAAGAFAREAGLAFQLADDLLGLYADEAALGKPVGSDLATRKATRLLTLALAGSSGAAHERLVALLGRPLSAAELEEARSLVSASGAKAKVEEEARSLVASALRQLDLFPEHPRRQTLVELAHYLVDRHY